MKIIRLIVAGSYISGFLLILVSSGYACETGSCCCSTTNGLGGYACKTTDLCDAAGGTCYDASNCDSSKPRLHKAEAVAQTSSMLSLEKARKILESVLTTNVLGD